MIGGDFVLVDAGEGSVLHSYVRSEVSREISRSVFLWFSADRNLDILFSSHRLSNYVGLPHLKLNIQHSVKRCSTAQHARCLASCSSQFVAGVLRYAGVTFDDMTGPVITF